MTVNASTCDDGTSLAASAALKLAAIAACFLTAWGAALVPIRTRTRSHSTHGTTSAGLGNAFAAGIFLSMSLLHFLPEAGRTMTADYGDTFVARFSPHFALCVIAYSAMLLVQRVVFPTPMCPLHVKGAPHFCPEGGTRGSSGDRGSQCGTPVAVHAEGPHEGGGRAVAPGGGGSGSGGAAAAPSAGTGGHHSEPHGNRAPFAKQRSTSYGATHETAPAVGASAAAAANDRCAREHSSNDDDDDDHGGGGAAVSTCCPGDHCVEHEPHVLLSRSERIASSRSLVLFLALSLHGLAEGLTLGIQCGASDVLLVAGAIVSHKWAEALALGTSLAAGLDSAVMTPRAAPSADAVTHARAIAAVFAMSSPVGVAGGWLAHALLPPTAKGVLTAASAGTFLYIGASEVVVEEFVQGRQYFGKWLAFVFGWLIIHVVHVFVVVHKAAFTRAH